jgi:hypothetical protein
MAKFEHVMKKIGFRGFGDHTHGGLTFFLSLVLGVLTSIFVGAFVDELMFWSPSVQDLFINHNIAVVFIMLGAFIVISFLAVYWRHFPLIILFALFSATGIFNLVHSGAIEKGKYFPSALTARFTPSPERMKEIEQFRAERLATVKDSYFGKDISDIMNPFSQGSTTLAGERVFPGDIVTITAKNPKTNQYTVQYKGKEATLRSVRDFKYLRTDRSAFLRHECALLKWAAENADAVKDIPKGKKVVLTGNISIDNLTVEVTHNGDTGWLRHENLKF